MQRVIYYTIAILFSVYVLLLFAGGQLGFYIHPRYITFSVIMAIVALSFGLIGMAVSFKEDGRRILLTLRNIARAIIHDRKLMLFLGSLVIAFFANLFFVISAMLILLPFPDSKFDQFLRRNIWGEALLFGLLLVAFLLPARPLSSATASQRSLDFNALNVSDRLNTAQPFSFSSDKYNIGDWVTSLSLNPDISYYVGKQLDVTGFVFTPEGLDSGYFLVSRFVITCCAVDARPVGIPVEAELGEIKQDDWVEIKGKFDSGSVQGKQQVIIVPDSITKVDIPANPYIY